MTDAKEVWVLCFPCTQKAMEDIEGFFTVQMARNPAEYPGADDVAVLTAPTLEHVDPFKMRTSAERPCEGCGRTVYVSPSSQWLLDMKARVENTL